MRGCRVGLLRCLATTGFLAGCATVPLEHRFAEFRERTTERTGQAPEWIGVSSPDDAVAARVDEWLAAPLTPDSAVQVALLNNRRLQATYAEFGIALADLVQSRLPRNPLAEASLRLNAGEGQHWEIRAVQDFLQLLLIPLRHALAKAEFEQARLQIQNEVLEIVTETRTAFYELQKGQQTLDLMRGVLVTAEAAYEMAWRLQQAGNFSELRVQQERALYEQTKLQTAEAEQQVMAARERLNRVLGLWGAGTRWTFVPELAQPPAEELALAEVEQEAIQNSLDLAMAWLDLEIAARRLGIRNLESVLPELETGMAFESEREHTYFPREKLGDTLWWRGPSVTVPIPLFDQSQAAAVRGRSEIRQRWDTFTAQAIEIRSVARLLRYQVTYQRNQAEYYRTVVLPVRRRLRLETQLHYNAMFLGVFQLLDARRQEIATGKEHLHALSQYWTTRAQLEQLLMGSLPELGEVEEHGLAQMDTDTHGRGWDSNGSE